MESRKRESRKITELNLIELKICLLMKKKSEKNLVRLKLLRAIKYDLVIKNKEQEDSFFMSNFRDMDEERLSIKTI